MFVVLWHIWLQFTRAIKYPISELKFQRKRGAHVIVNQFENSRIHMVSLRTLSLFLLYFLPSNVMRNWTLPYTQAVSGEIWSTSKEIVSRGRGGKVCVFCEIQQLYCLEGGTNLRGTKRRRWSGDSEPETAEVPLSAPEPQSNLLKFHHRRSSWHKSGST